MGKRGLDPLEPRDLHAAFDERIENECRLSRSARNAARYARPAVAVVLRPDRCLHCVTRRESDERCVDRTAQHDAISLIPVPRGKVGRRPLASSCPRSRTATRSQNANASSVLCVASRIVQPRRPASSSRRNRRNCCADNGSSVRVGSSRRSIRGFVSSARAINSRWRMPDENSDTRLVPQSDRPTVVRTLVTREPTSATATP